MDFIEVVEWSPEWKGKFHEVAGLMKKGARIVCPAHRPYRINGDNRFTGKACGRYSDIR